MISKDIAYSIGTFIEKYPTTQVEILGFGYSVKQIAQVVIDKDSIKEYGETVTFEGKATVIYSDGKTPIRTVSESALLQGSAAIQEINNLPDVKSVTINIKLR